MRDEFLHAAGRFLAILSLTPPVLAQEPVPEDHRHDPPDARGDALAEEGGLLERERLLGAWDLRRSLAERGVAVAAFLTADLSGVARGGLDTGKRAFRHLFDLGVTVDLARAGVGVPGLVEVVYQNQGGDDGSELVGDLQAFSNIDADGRSQIARAWYQVALGSVARTRLGKMDANSQFAYVEAAGRFLSSSAGYSPTILTFPTYPDPAFGATAFLGLGPRLELGLGVFDGAGAEGIQTGELGPSTLFHAPSDLFGVAELDLRWRTRSDRAGRLAVGAWHHAGDLERFDGGTDAGTSGGYAVAEQLVLGSEIDRDGALALFLQLGEADGDLSPFDRHLAAGAVWTGFLPERDLDHMGFYASRARFTDEPAAGFEAEAELALELFYSFALTPWVSLKPDIQYIRDPGGRGEAEDAWVWTLRCTVRL